MFAPPPNPQELAFWGLTLEDVALQNQVEVWAQHWQAIELFCQMSTQWRVGAAGAVGLDYAVLFRLFDLQDIDESKQKEILAQIQICESAALDIFYKDKKS